MNRVFKIHGLLLTIDDTMQFSFEDDMLQVLGTFNVARKLRNGKYAGVSNTVRQSMHAN